MQQIVINVWEHKINWDHKLRLEFHKFNKFLCVELFDGFGWIYWFLINFFIGCYKFGRSGDVNKIFFCYKMLKTVIQISKLTDKVAHRNRIFQHL